MIGRAALAVVAAPILFGAAMLAAQQDQQWVADQSTFTYHMSHPMHDLDGVSHEAKGKGVCRSGQCDLLIAVPVKSFVTGDSNRDLHMLEAVRGAQFPMIVVHAHFPQAEISQPVIHADLEVQFAGQTANYKDVQFRRTQQGSEVHIDGSIPLTCSDFKIDRPSFLTVPIKNDIPVRVEMNWHSQ